jgi:predicted glycoside hydrolase/deacetylase ChbG (UPF0249 family)
MLRTMATSQSDRPPQFPVKRALDLLGYPADTKLLIIHADDLGMCHSVNAAIFKALDEQTISSASAMVPCPGFGEAAEYAKRNPGRDLGIHLTLTSEWEKYRWGPVLGSQSCASLIDESGYFFGSTKNGKREIGEVRKELSAQVEQAVRAGLAPSHLDSHMLFPLENRDLAKAYIELGRHYEVPFLMSTSWTPGLESEIRETDILVDNVYSIRPGLPEQEWKNYYLRVLHSLKRGLSQLIVHPGFDDAELQAVTAGRAFWGAAWRQRDYDAVMSTEFRAAIRDNNIQVVSWKQLNSLKQTAGVVSEH